MNEGKNYGSRIRGYIHAPASGDYVFWISGDDQAELWLSEDESPSNKRKIAEAKNNSSMRQWEKHPHQKSEEIWLEKGRKYYIEVLHKENEGGDHVAVGWRLADGTFERPIPCYRLSPFVPEQVLAVDPVGKEGGLGNIKLFPNPVKDRLIVEINGPRAGEASWSVLDLQGKEFLPDQNLITLGSVQPLSLKISRLQLPAGFYLLRVRTNEAQELLRFVKE